MTAVVIAAAVLAYMAIGIGTATMYAVYRPNAHDETEAGFLAVVAILWPTAWLCAIAVIIGAGVLALDRMIYRWSRR